MFKNKLCADRGSAFIELAIALPLISLVLIGAAELGRIAYFAIEVSDAARAGVAYGAQRLAYAEDTGSLASGINDGIAVAAMDDASDLSNMTTTSNDACVCESVTTSTGAITTTPISVCGGTSSTAATQCPPSTTSGVVTDVANYVQVNTAATVTTMFHYPGIPSSFTLHGFAAMRVAGD